MSNQKPQDQLINLAMRELEKVLANVKDGKTPEMPSSMQKLASELSAVNEKSKTMSEEEIKQFAEKLVKEISKLE